MPVPSTIADCNATASNNYPTGSESIGTSLDDYLRSHAAILRQVYDASLIPSGTRMPFAQASAPTGWTQATSDNEDNRMLRVVKTAGGSVAGSHSPILCNVVPTHTHTFTSGNQSDQHSHYVNDPGHNHYVNDPGHSHSLPGTMQNYGTISVSSVLTGISSASTGGAGTGIWLNSSGTGVYLSNSTENHTHSGTVNANGSASDWTPRYIDMIICSKN